MTYRVETVSTGHFKGEGQISAENTGSHCSVSLLLHLWSNGKVTDRKASSHVKTPNCYRLSLQETNPKLTTLPF